MSKSPLKQMDQGLVGAYRRAKMAGVPRGGDGMSKAMDDIIGTSKDFMKDVQKHKANESKRIADSKKEGEELSATILETSGALSENFFNAFSTNVKGLQEQFNQAAKDGNKDEESKLLGHMNLYSGETTALTELRNSIASTFDTQTVDGKESPNLIKNLNEHDQGLLKAMIDPSTPVKTEIVDGKVITKITYNGKEYTKAEIEQKLHDSREDVVSINDIQKIRDKIKSNSFQDASVNNAISSWDEAETTNQISKVLRSGNMVSLANDDILGNGRSFKEDLLNSPALAKIDYASLGLDPNTVIEVKDTEGRESSIMLDANNDGKLSPEEVKYLSDEDKAKIVEAYTNPENDFYNEDNTRSLMTGYLTQHMKNNYDKLNADVGAVKKQGTSESADEFMKELGI